MAGTSAHHEEVEDFVAAEILMLSVENRKLQCIDHTADCVNDSAGEKPSEFCPKWVSSVLYISMGWICVLAFSQILNNLTRAEFGWLLAGGIIYTIGGVIYALKLPAISTKIIIWSIFFRIVLTRSERSKVW